MPTKTVVDAGVAPVDSLESGVEATLLVAGPDMDGVTGKYFDRLREVQADVQTDDPGCASTAAPAQRRAGRVDGVARLEENGMTLLGPY